MSELGEEWNSLPTYGSQQRLMITSAIPYNFRWRILQLKQMLYDLEYLAKKYDIKAAIHLMEAVRREAEDLLMKLTEEIYYKRQQREETTK